MAMSGNILPLIVMLLCSTVLNAGVLTGYLDKNEGTTEDQFQYTLSIQGDVTGDVDFPAVDGLKVVHRGQSSSVKIINGDMTREFQLTFVLEVEREGVFEIPAIKLMVDDRIESTLPLKLRVKALTMEERRQTNLLMPKNAPKGNCKHELVLQILTEPYWYLAKKSFINPTSVAKGKRGSKSKKKEGK